MDSASSSRRVAFIAVAAVAVAAAASPAAAKVFHSRTAALEMAFPGADRIEGKTFVLREDEVERIERRMRGHLERKLARVYTAVRGDDILGYAVIDVHDVRTLAEAIMVVLTPTGTVRSLRILAFHEPLEYLPAERWYRQFENRSLAEPLRLGGDIHGVVGATLTARATTQAVRRALAYYEVLVAAETDARSPSLSR